MQFCDNYVRAREEHADHFAEVLRASALVAVSVNASPTMIAVEILATGIRCIACTLARALVEAIARAVD